MIELRDYQKECIEAMEADDSPSQLVVLPTGSGKTVIFLSYLIRQNKKALILAHTLDLIRQTYDALAKLQPDFKFEILNEFTDIKQNKILISTIQTVCRKRRLQQLKASGFEIIVIDEAHHAMSDSYQNVVDELGFSSQKSKKLIGFTATPVRGDSQSLAKLFKKEVYRKDVFDLIQRGILTDVVGYRIKTGVSLNGIRSQCGDFQINQLTAAINTQERNQLCLKSFLDICCEKKTLIFCSNIKHSEDIAKLFSEKGVPCKAVHGRLHKQERADIIREFKNGDIRVITNCQLLTEGFDEPSIGALIMARPTKSLPLYVQMVGRGIRTSPGKDHCVLVELTDNAHSICSLPQLADEEANTFYELEDGEKLSDIKTNIEKKKKQLLKSDSRIIKDVFKPFQSQASRFENVATENQISLLKQWQIDFSLPLTYQTAAVMIGNYRRNYG